MTAAAPDYRRLFLAAPRRHGKTQVAIAMEATAELLGLRHATIGNTDAARRIRREGRELAARLDERPSDV